MSYETSNLIGSDIDVTASGDAALVTGTLQGEQRVLRRLLTNPGDYIQHPEYGGGLPRFVGKLLRHAEIEGVIRQQLTLEAVVSQSPSPTILITPILNGVSVAITYVDADTGEQASVEFDT